MFRTGGYPDRLAGRLPGLHLQRPDVAAAALPGGGGGAGGGPAALLHPGRYYLHYIYSIYISTPPSCCTSSAPSTRGPSTACPRTPPSWSGSSRGASSWSSSMSSSSSIHVDDAVWTSILYDPVYRCGPLTAIPRPAELRTWHRRVARHEARIKEGRDSKPPPLPPQQSVFSR